MVFGGKKKKKGGKKGGSYEYSYYSSELFGKNDDDKDRSTKRQKGTPRKASSRAISARRRPSLSTSRLPLMAGSSLMSASPKSRSPTIARRTSSLGSRSALDSSASYEYYSDDQGESGGGFFGRRGNKRKAGMRDLGRAGGPTELTWNSILRVWFVDKSIIITVLVQIMIIGALYMMRAIAAEEAEADTGTVDGGEVGGSGNGSFAASVVSASATGSAPSVSGYHPSLGVVIGIFFFQVVNMAMVVASAFFVLEDLKAHNISIWFLMKSYLATCVAFGGLYFTLLIGVDETALRGLSNLVDRDYRFYFVYVLIDTTYFSITTMSTVGYGEITPNINYALIICVLQQAVSVFYSAVIFGVGISHFVESLQSTSQRRRAEKRRRASVAAGLSNEGSERRSSGGGPRRGGGETRSCMASVRHTLARFAIPITVAFEAVILSALYLIDPVIFDDNKALATSVGDALAAGGICLAQLIVVVVTGLVGYQLYRDIHHNNFSRWHLLYAYIATVLCFASLYAVVFHVMPHAFAGLDRVGLDGSVVQAAAALHPVERVLRFVYLSTTVMSTCGFGDILPTESISRLLCNAQQLLTIGFASIVFSSGIAPSSA